jgi:hypothetical protein
MVLLLYYERERHAKINHKVGSYIPFFFIYFTFIFNGGVVNITSFFFLYRIRDEILLLTNIYVPSQGEFVCIIIPL